MNITWKFRRYFWRRLMRFIAWFPVIWRDEDWDSVYLFEIMRFKISRIRKEMTRNKRHVDCEKDIHNMKVAEQLLDRMAFSEFWIDNYEKCKDDRCTCPKDWGDTIFREDADGNLRWRWSNCTYCKWLIRSPIMRKEMDDSDYLWDLLKKESRRWWD